MSKTIRIDQAVFGYRDGHHLIASSIPLPPGVRQSLANVTDGSGPESFGGFDGAFTGLPLPQIEYYALFCTWTAPEMSRPGCVWSHVLLVPFSELGNIPNLAELTTFFLRPNASLPFNNYEAPVFLDTGIQSHSVFPLPLQWRMVSTLQSLYGESDSDVVVLDREAGLWTDIIFPIWSQQWPKLRQTFSFSTGSLGDRRLAGFHFDIQVAPLSSARLWSRSTRSTKLIDYSEAGSPVPEEGWLLAAFQDAVAGGSSLRSHLWRYGEDTKNYRSAFIPLVQLSIAPEANDDDDLGERLRQIAAAFPAKDDAIALKRENVGMILGRSPEESLQDLWSLVYFLLCTPEGESFQSIPISFEGVTELLWRRKRADLLALVGRLPLSIAATQFVESVAQKLSPKDTALIWKEQRKAFSRIVEARPNLAASHLSWDLPRAGQVELWSILKGTTIGPDVWASICVAMMKADICWKERETVVFAENHLESALVKWTGTQSFTMPSASWRDALREPLNVYLRHGHPAPQMIAFAFATARLEDFSRVEASDYAFRALTRNALLSLPPDLRPYGTFWSTALGLKTPGEPGLFLLSASFFLTYEAVANSNYPDDAWEVLWSVLPGDSYIPDWDRCKKMRHALKKWIEDNESLSREWIEELPPEVRKKAIKKR